MCLRQNDIGYIVGSFGGTLELKDNCFDQNEVSRAAVISESGTQIVSSNYGRNKDEKKHRCEFLVVLDAALQDAFSCTSFDGSSCSGINSLKNEQDYILELDLPDPKPVEQSSSQLSGTHFILLVLCLFLHI